jgi:hypothetical protein
MRKLFIAIVTLSFIFANYSSAQAVEPLEPLTQNSYQFEASIGESGLNKDLSFLAFDGELQLGLPAGRIGAPTIVTLNRNEESVSAPAGFNAAAVTYQITIPSAAFVAGNYYLSLKSSGSAQLKKIYFFNTDLNLWQPINSNENFGKGLVSATLFSPSIKLAIFL